MALSLVPVGAVVKRVYFKVPGHYGEGPETEQHTEAWKWAIERWSDIYVLVRDSYPRGWRDADKEAERCADIQALVETRFVFDWDAGGLDTPVERKHVRDSMHRSVALQNALKRVLV